MKAPKALFLMVLIAAMVSATAFSLQPLGEIQKGNALRITGSCAMDVDINAFFSGSRILTLVAPCANSTFSVEQNTGPNEPTGTWVVIAESGGERLSQNAIVKNTRASQTLQVTFLSALSPRLNRGQSVELDLRVEFGGQPVDNANVMVWGLDEVPWALESEGNGVYHGEKPIRLDAGLGERSVQVVASALAESNRYSGSDERPVEIAPATLIIDFVEPSGDVWENGITQTIQIRVRYVDQQIPRDTHVSLQNGANSVPLLETERGTFVVDWAFSPDATGAQTLTFRATDAFGNSGERSRGLTVRTGFGGLIRQNMILLIGIGVVLVILGAFIFPVIAKRGRHQYLLKQKAHLEKQAEVLQRDYFERNSIDRTTFDSKSADLQHKLVLVEKELGKY